MTNLYTVTFNIVKEKSTVQEMDYFSNGHIWYELQKEQEETHRFGLFQEKFERENKGNIDSDSSSITIQITQEQYNKLYEFGQTPSDLGFRPSSNSFFGNSVDFVFSALKAIDYNFDFESSVINSADNAFEGLIDILSKNNAVFGEENNFIPINERKEIILSHYRQTGVYKSPGIGSFSSKNGYSSNSNSQSSSVDAGNNSASNSKQYSNSHNQDKSSSGSASNKVKVDIFNPNGSTPDSSGNSSGCAGPEIRGLSAFSVFTSLYSMALKKLPVFKFASMAASLYVAVRKYRHSSDATTFRKDLLIAVSGIGPGHIGMFGTAFGLAGAGTDYYTCSPKKGSKSPNPPEPPTLGGLVPPQGPPDIDPASQASSPLIIDMDRNGIKTISIDKGVFFDLDNNLFAENTGWVGQGDALLVWDRDGNGIIDSGNELFGNNTLLANGSKAANGFAALAELDSNNDKVFDEQDEAWAKLQLWFDHNQNGISEEGELINLSESGIKSINLAYKNIKHTDENGNAHRQQSSVTWHNGETSEITDVWFKVNTAKSYYREEIEVSDEIKAMPNIIAFGNVLNLHEAMAKNSTLKNVVQEYIDTDVEKRSSLLNYLIYEWTGTVNVDPESRGSHIDARKVAVLELLTGKAFKQGSSSNPGVNAAKMLEEEFKKFADYTLAQIESNSIYREAFAVTSFLVNAETGELEFDWENLNTAIANLVEANNFIEAKRVVAIAKNLGIYNDDYLAVIDQNFAELAETDSKLSYLFNNALVESDSDGIVVSGSKDNDFMTGNSQDNILEAGNGNDVLFGGAGNDLLKGGLGSDTYIFSKGHGQDIIQEQNHWMHSRDRDTLRFTDVSYDEVKFRRVKNDLILFGYHDKDSITIENFYTHSDYEIEIFEFADRTFTIDELREEGMRLYGTDGNDVINDWNSNSIIDAGAGDDVINAGRGNDTLIGGEGDDTLRGGLGADTYIFSKGHGQDIIQEQNHWMHSRDRDTLRFTDVSYDEVKFRRVENDLILFGYHDKDSITIENFYTHSDYEIEIFEFADRTFTIDELRKEGMRLYGTDGNDVINDWNSNSIIDAGAGDDIINAGDGDDTLIGGTGNDILNGGLGSDTYIFSKGHGQDIIREENRWMRLLNNKDTIRFTDVDYDEVKFRRVENDLILFGYHDKDSITIENFYADRDYEIENFEFADSTLSLRELKEKGIRLYGTDGDDVINDWNDNSIIYAGAGDDIINAGDGDDTLIGGTGNDILNGGLGSDTYIFSKGHGQDIIQEWHHWIRLRDKDTIRFTDVNYNEVKFKRVGNDLILSGYHQDDSVTIQDFYRDSYYEVEIFEFADRILTLQEIKDSGITQYGTEGDDKLVGGKGNDTFIGGAGNDILNGGLGSDTYLFGNNHGHDVIQENANRNDQDSDTIQFTEIDNPNQLWFSRQNNDLLIRDLENFDSSVRVKNWYRHKDYKVEQIKLANEQALDIASVEKLVQAMAAFDAAHSGDITLAPREEVQQYMDKLAVANYWG